MSWKDTLEIFKLCVHREKECIKNNAYLFSEFLNLENRSQISYSLKYLLIIYLWHKNCSYQNETSANRKKILIFFFLFFNAVVNFVLGGSTLWRRITRCEESWSMNICPACVIMSSRYRSGWPVLSSTSPGVGGARGVSNYRGYT